MAESDPLDPKAVTDRDSFLAFVRALAEDRRMSVAAERASPISPYGADAGGWENVTIETFLEAALAWAEDSRRFPVEPSWQAFATFLVLWQDLRVNDTDKEKTFFSHIIAAA
jgi:hypothetical protein